MFGYILNLVFYPLRKVQTIAQKTTQKREKFQKREQSDYVHIK